MRIILIFLFVITFTVGFVPAHFLNKEILSIDDTSYIAHSMTFGIDFDFDYTNEIAKKFTANGDVPNHPYGTGILSAPFVMLGGIIDYFSGNNILQERKITMQLGLSLESFFCIFLFFIGNLLPN